MSKQKSCYIGRFAPSPTGPLHLGSLYAALASFLQARVQNGKWLLRIDDLDTFRNVSGASQSILDTLQIYGLQWDDAIFYQSEHQDNYQSAVKQLVEQKLVYPCVCSRKSLSGQSVYPGYCLNRQLEVNAAYALRIKTADIKVSFTDEIQGQHSHALRQQHGDFIVKRKDNIIAYQLAVVIDDYRQNITHVVRGFDLLHSTAKQLFLQQVLGFPAPAYCHVPMIVDQQGNKLSKQTFAQAVSSENPQKILCLILSLLKQNPPDNLKTTSVHNIIQWAIENWHPEALKKIRAINRGIY